MLLIKNPAGANEAVRTIVDGGAPSLAVIALNDAIADGRDVSWIWDVDFEPLLDGLERVVVTGDRAAELGAALQVRRASTASAIEVVPSLERGARPRARADTGRRRARRPPHLHGDARAAADRRRARPRAAVLGASRVKIVVGHLYPDYLNIYADRGNIAVLDAARGAGAATSSTVQAISIGDALVPGEHDLLYIGGGQDREQALVAHDLVAKGDALRDCRRGRRGGARGLRRLPAARPLLPRSRAATSCPGVGLFPLTRSPASGG